jgi:PAS domain S-box-containing protein
MKNPSKTKQELLDEISFLKERIKGLEQSEIIRKQTEEELRQKTSLFEAQLNSSIEGILVVDVQGKKVFQNQRTIDLWKIPKPIADNDDDQMQVDHAMCMTKNPKQFVDKVVYLYSHPEETSHDEVELTDGTVLDRYSSPVLDKDGKYYGRIWAFRDITERKRTEEMLRENTIRYQELFESMGSGAAVYKTFNDGEDFIFQEYNASAEMLDKTPRERVIGKSVVEVFPGVKDFGLFDVFQRVHKTGKPESHPITFYKDERISAWRENYVYKLPSNEIVAVFEDITKRKRTEEALRESEERFRLAADAGHAMVYDLDVRTRQISALHGLPGLLGRDAAEAELTLEWWDRFIHPEDLEMYHAVFQKMYNDPHDQATQYRLCPEDGRILFVEDHATPVCDDTGQLVRIVGTVMDITDRKLAAEALRGSEELLRVTLENIVDPVFITDDEGTFTFICSNAPIVLGYPVEELMAMGNISMLFGKRLFTLDQLQAQGEIHNLESVIVKKDGSRRDYLVNIKQVSIKNGTILYTCHDITERKQAEESLRESTRDYGLLATHHKRLNDISIAFAEASSIEDLYNHIAKSFQYLTGATAATFAIYNQVDRALRVVSLSIDPILGAKVNSILGSRLFEMRMPVSADVMEQMLKDGIRRPINLHDLSFGVIPQDVSDSIMDVIGCRQIVSLAIAFGEELIGTCVAYLTGNIPAVPDDALKTYIYLSGLTVKRRWAEEQIHESLREKEILLGEIHHRTKNNMQIMSGLLDLQASSTGNPELIAMLNQAQRRIRAMALVHEILLGSKDFASMHLADYVRSLSQELFQAHDIHSGRIDLIIQADSHVYVDINRATSCGLILNELISNALKHAFPGDGRGEIRIVISKTKDAEIEIVVHDNGLGLPADIDIHRPHSVGLHLVNGLVVKQLDGQIEVRRDVGTEFRIKFPLLSAENREVI